MVELGMVGVLISSGYAARCCPLLPDSGQAV